MNEARSRRSFPNEGSYGVTHLFQNTEPIEGAVAVWTLMYLRPRNSNFRGMRGRAGTAVAAGERWR